MFTAYYTLLVNKNHNVLYKWQSKSCLFKRMLLLFIKKSLLLKPVLSYSQFLKVLLLMGINNIDVVFYRLLIEVICIDVS